MKRYSSNYCTRNNNYIININLPTSRSKNETLYSTYCVIQNIIQRGNPTKPSKYLLKELPDFTYKNLRYMSGKKEDWSKTIRGYDGNNDNPAKIFYEEILSENLGGFNYAKHLIIPEASFKDIVCEENSDFKGSQADFYFPQCRLVIEIDGIQHQKSQEVSKDKIRDEYLKKNGIKVIRIPVYDIKEYIKGNKKSLQKYFDKMINICKDNLGVLKEYRTSIDKLKEIGLNQDFLKLDGIIRFQNLLLELLKEGVLSLEDEKWIFNVKTCDIDVPWNTAINDIFKWIENLLKLQEIKFVRPKIVINSVDEFNKYYKGINVDFSLFRKFDDTVFEDGICFIRGDYYDDKDYFEVATSNMIKYKIKSFEEEDKIDSLSFLLENLFGFGSFNEGQLPIIINALNLNDTIGLLPTGGGKSLCYQLCCILQPAINFVVSPIKALMYDQKQNLDNQGIINTDYITSDQDGEEKQKVIKNFGKKKYFCIWISPERFQSESFRDELKGINANYNIGYAVIDEVHCLSEWGHDFRTSYLNLSKTIRNICSEVVFLGLTATASKNVLQDIKAEFEVDESNIKTILDYTRPELTFKVIEDIKGKKIEKTNNLFSVLNELITKEEAFQTRGLDSKCGIIFTPHVNGEYGCHYICNEIRGKSHIQSVQYFSGEIPKKESMSSDFDKYKMSVQKKFKDNETTLLVATKAFGMGIDKSNIRYTIHYGLPSSIESFYQEAGRAGRDKKSAKCYLLYSKDTLDESEKDILFNLNTSVKELGKIVEKYQSSAGDIIRNLYLTLKNNNGVEEEAQIAFEIYRKWCHNMKNAKLQTFKEDSRDIIKTSDFKSNNITCNSASVEKGIYRLSLLGIVKDWVVQTWGYSYDFKLYKGSDSEYNIKKSVTEYIRKYDVEFDFSLITKNNERYKDYYRITQEDIPFVLKMLKIVIQWSYNNIFYSRRESQRNLQELCDDYFVKGEDYFKEKLEGYFKIDNSTNVLDYLANNPYDFKELYKLIKNEKTPTLKEKINLEQINRGLSRFLESYRFNTALNYLNGILSLLLDTYKDSINGQRFKSAFETIVTKDNEFKNMVLDETLDIGKILCCENKEKLSEVLCNYYDDYDKIYNSLKDDFSLNKILEDKVERLKAIGGRLNG